MNTKTARKLRTIAKGKGLRRYYKLKKANLVALLLEQSAEEMPTSLQRASGKEKRCALPIKIISSPQEMDEFEKEEMRKTQPVVKNRLNEWYDWLVDYVPKPINPIQDGEGGEGPLPTSFSPVTSTNVGFGPQNFLTFSFNPFATLVQNFKFVPSVSPKLLNLNQDHPSKKTVFLVKSL